MKTLSSWDALLAAPAPCDHLVQLYTSDEALTSTVARFIEHGLADGEGVIAIATAGHWTAIAGRLAANGVDDAAPQARNQLIVRDAHDTQMSDKVERMPQRAIIQ